MFDRIALRYDLLNHLLSAGQDYRWRARLTRELASVPHDCVLDLATGTGDQLFSLDQRCGPLGCGLGIDISIGMLTVGQQKLLQRGLAGRLALVQGDAMRLPVSAAAADAVTISFGIRNVADVPVGLAEMHRVLRPGGHLFILEFGLPANALLRALYLLYFRHVLPVLGGLVSGDSAAYRYLNQTVETFPHGDAFCELLRTAGFSSVRAHAMTFGVVYLYHATRT